MLPIVKTIRLHTFSPTNETLKALIEGASFSSRNIVQVTVTAGVGGLVITDLLTKDTLTLAQDDVKSFPAESFIEFSLNGAGTFECYYKE